MAKPLKFVADMRARERNPNAQWEVGSRDCSPEEKATVEHDMAVKYPSPHFIRTTSYRTSGRGVYPRTYRFTVRAYIKAKDMATVEGKKSCPDCGEWVTPGTLHDCAYRGTVVVPE